MSQMEDTGERLIPEGNQQTLTYGEHISRYVSLAHIVKSKRVLDVASGSGYGSQFLAQHAKSVDGLDYFEDAVRYSNETYPADNLTYTHGNAEAMPYDNNSFDVVISLETIEHLYNPEKFVLEVKRVLKDDGIFVVSTPNDDEFMDGNIYHVHEFQFKELNVLMSKHFDSHEYYYQGTYFAAGLFNRSRFTNSFSESTVHVESTFGSTIDKAIYFIAVASNNGTALPEIEQNIVLSDRWSTKDDLERDEQRSAEKKLLNDDISIYRIAAEEARNELAAIKSSKAWMLVTNVRKVKNKVRLKKENR